MRRKRLLDLFCGAGGAAMGYHRAGFDVVGVDNRPQPRYPFEFVQADALAWDGFDGFDAVHASPPCQAYSRSRTIRNRKHPNLVAPTRTLLVATGLPYVIENVPGAPLLNPVRVCMPQVLRYDGFELRRHRLFEANWPLAGLACSCGELPAAPVFGHNPDSSFMRRYGRGYNIDARRAVMGIDWMNRDELAEAIPPAFAELVGSQLIKLLAAVA